MVVIYMFIVCTFLVLSQISLIKSLIIFDHFQEPIIVIFFTKYIISMWFLLSIIFMALATLLWLYILSYNSLNKVYPLISMSYIIMLFFSYFLLNEPIVVQQIIGIIVIVIGVVILQVSH